MGKNWRNAHSRYFGTVYSFPKRGICIIIIAASYFYAFTLQLPILKEKLAEKEKRLSDARKEFLESRQVLNESFKNAVREVKKQYDAIDKALEVSIHLTYM